MEVSGQDILTRDKVSLRVNLTALWQVLDAVKARGTLQNFVEFVYKELQFALREAVGAARSMSCWVPRARSIARSGRPRRRSSRSTACGAFGGCEGRDPAG